MTACEFHHRSLQNSVTVNVNAFCSYQNARKLDITLHRSFEVEHTER